MFVFNRPQRKLLRQQLRNAHVPAEGLLWAQLKQRQFLGLKFRRQYGVGPFMVDFYCPEKRIAIELDGDSHAVKAMKHYERQRSQYIEQYDIQLIRFTNQEIYQALDRVLERLATVCSTTPSWPAPRFPS